MITLYFPEGLSLNSEWNRVVAVKANKDILNVSWSVFTVLNNAKFKGKHDFRMFFGSGGEPCFFIQKIQLHLPEVDSIETLRRLYQEILGDEVEMKNKNDWISFLDNLPKGTVGFDR